MLPTMSRYYTHKVFPVYLCYMLSLLICVCSVIKSAEVFGTGCRADSTEGRGGSSLGEDRNYFPPFYAEFTYVEWISTNCKFLKMVWYTTSHTTDSIYLTIFLHRKTQTKREITVRLRQQLKTKPIHQPRFDPPTTLAIPSTDNALTKTLNNRSTDHARNPIRQSLSKSNPQTTL